MGGVEVSTFWSNRRVLVTGATGFIGSWLTRSLLGGGASVVSLVMDWDPQSDLIRSGIIGQTSVVSGRLEDLSTLRRAVNEHEVQTVFHLGAQTIVEAAHRDPLQTFESNIRGTYNLLEACRLAPSFPQVILASSDKAYGSTTALPYTEDMPAQGRQPYEVSKAAADLIGQSYFEAYRLPVGIVRSGNTFGGGDLHWSRVVPGTIRSLLRSEQPVIRSDGTLIRDYLYVKDAVAGYMLLAEMLEDPSLQGEAFNLGTEQPSTVLEVVSQIRELTGRMDLEPIVLNQASGEIPSQWLSWEKASRTLGWKPTYTLTEGLDETIDWYRVFLG